jgi:hypothetical protein
MVSAVDADRPARRGPDVRQVLGRTAVGGRRVGVDLLEQVLVGLVTLDHQLPPLVVDPDGRGLALSGVRVGPDERSVMVPCVDNVADRSSRTPSCGGRRPVKGASREA